MMMVYKVTVHYLCYPPQMGHQSVGLSSNRWTVQKSICGPFEKFHSMLISAIHGKLQSHNILSQEALATHNTFLIFDVQILSDGRMERRTLMICTSSQADRQTFRQTRHSAMTNRISLKGCKCADANTGQDSKATR